MKRFEALMAIALALASLVNVAEACNRCGHKGAACKFEQQKQHAAKQEIQINFVGVPVPTVYGQIAQQGNTVWGYGVGDQYPGLAAFAAAFGKPVDSAVLANITNKLVDRVGTGLTELSAVISQESAGQAEVAKILAKGQAAAQTLAAVEATAAPTPQRVQFEITSQAGGGFSVQQVGGRGAPSGTAGTAEPERPVAKAADVPEDVRSQPRSSGVAHAGDLQSILKQRCNACHAKQKAKDLRGLADWSLDDIDAVIDRLESDDGAERMPKGGAKLKRSELQEFYAARREAEARAVAGAKGILVD